MAKKKETASPAKEEWRPVVGFDVYEVSNEGRVRSLPRKTATGILGGRVLTPEVAQNGYLRVTFSVAGKAQRKLLHRVVLLTFVGPAPEGFECRHLDGNRANCAVANLAWGSRSENAYDRVQHGTQFNNKGERHGMTRLSDAEASEIMALRLSGISLDVLANRFSVSQSTVSRIATGTGWKHINNRSAP